MYRTIENLEEKSEGILKTVDAMLKLPPSQWLTNKQIGEIFGVSTATVWRVRRGKNEKRIKSTTTLPSEIDEEQIHCRRTNELVKAHWPSPDLSISSKHLKQHKGIYYIP